MALVGLLARYLENGAVRCVAVGAEAVVGAEVVVRFLIASAMVKPPDEVELGSIGPNPRVLLLILVGAADPTTLVEGPHVATDKDCLVVFRLIVDGSQRCTLIIATLLGLGPICGALEGPVARAVEVEPILLATERVGACCRRLPRQHQAEEPKKRRGHDAYPTPPHKALAVVVHRTRPAAGDCYPSKAVPSA